MVVPAAFFIPLHRYWYPELVILSSLAVAEPEHSVVMVLLEPSIEVVAVVVVAVTLEQVLQVVQVL
jgi:hypothetical protein